VSHDEDLIKTRRRPERTVKGEVKLREAKVTTLTRVQLERSCAMGGRGRGGRRLFGSGVLFIFFFIVGGLYSVTALRENDNERATVYTKHRRTLHSIFSIFDGLYSITALRKTGAEDKVFFIVGGLYSVRIRCILNTRS